MTDRGFGCVVRSAELLLVTYDYIEWWGGEVNKGDERDGGDEGGAKGMKEMKEKELRGGNLRKGQG